MLLSKNEQIDFIYFLLERRFPDFWDKELEFRQDLFFEWEAFLCPIIEYLPKKMSLDQLHSSKDIDFNYTALTHLVFRMGRDETITLNEKEIAEHIPQDTIERVAKSHYRIAEFLLRLVPQYELACTLDDFSSIDLDEEFRKLVKDS